MLSKSAGGGTRRVLKAKADHASAATPRHRPGEMGRPGLHINEMVTPIWRAFIAHLNAHKAPAGI